ncbi:MAG TPA: TRAP transporter small permease [Gammaproteobacteria bacterium]|nr:TRAP transporter small permease [Gammaproteobacteria bacterium]
MNGASRRRWLELADRLGRRLENTLLVVFLTALVVIASGQILLRNAFSLALPWSDGAVRVGVLWIALLGAVAASRDHKHIAIEVAAGLLPQGWQKPAAVLRHLITAAICALLAWFSWQFVADSRSYGDRLGSWPAWWFQLILPIGFALISYRYAVRSVQACFGGGETLPGSERARQDHSPRTGLEDR